MGFLERQALKFANDVRAAHGIPPAPRLSPGMRRRARECPLSRTIGPTIDGVDVLTDRYGKGRRGWIVLTPRGGFRLPYLAARFVARFDRGGFAHLRTVKPLPRGIEHLGFGPDVRSRASAVAPPTTRASTGIGSTPKPAAVHP
jgi:hypothetical protein